ncbi:hypothetical protein P7C73_g3655, partial [Tremellales sp. Uapishka_1]
MASSSAAPNFNFPEKKPSASEKALIDDICQLYQLKPVTSAYAHYDQKATFHDPVSIAEGLESIKAQFNGMPSIFSSSVTKALKVLDNPEVKPPSVQFSLSQDYTFKGIGTQKLVDSLITLHVDPSTNLITLHEEQWDGKENSTGEGGFFGKLNELRKKSMAGMINMGVSSTPKDQQ